VTYRRKTYKEKLLDKKDLPKVVKIKGKMAKKWLAGRERGKSRGTGTMVIPAPIEIDALMKKVPQGKVTTINEIRKAVAKKHGSTIACPITCGIFARIAAGAAEEDRVKGRKKITPYWRTLKGEGELNPKYPGGVSKLKTFLRGEGHKVVKKGSNKYVVLDFEKKLHKFV